MRLPVLCLVLCGLGVIQALYTPLSGEDQWLDAEHLAGLGDDEVISLLEVEHLGKPLKTNAKKPTKGMISMSKFKAKVLHKVKKKKPAGKKAKKSRPNWFPNVRRNIRKLYRKNTNEAYGIPAKVRVRPRIVPKRSCPRFWRRVVKRFANKKKFPQFQRMARSKGIEFFNWWVRKHRFRNRSGRGRSKVPINRQSVRRLRRKRRKYRSKRISMRDSRDVHLHVNRRVSRYARRLGIVASMLETNAVSRNTGRSPCAQPRVISRRLRQLAKKFAPVVIFDKREQFFPTSVKRFLRKTVIKGRGMYPRRLRFCTGRSGSLESCIKSSLPWTKGISYNAKGRVPPVYTIVNKRGKYLDFTYWVFYAFSAGKRHCFKRNGTCYRRSSFPALGAQIGDWESVTVRTYQGKRVVRVAMSAHDFTIRCRRRGNNRWARCDSNKHNRRQFRSSRRLKLGFIKHHPVVFVARKSHGFWPNPGKSVYRANFKKLSCPFTTNLVDRKSRGRHWRTWLNIKVTPAKKPETYTGDLCFLNAKMLWGVPEAGCLRQLAPARVCVLGRSPRGPVYQRASRKPFR